MARAKVAVLKTAPETVFQDVARAMHLADYALFLPRENDTALKINISWHHWYPACSTAPWQLEGVIKTLLADGYRRESIYGCHNRTVVVSARKGEVVNKHRPIIEAYGLRNIHLYEGEEWVRFQPKTFKFSVLDQVYPDGVLIPKRFFGNNIIHLPTVKTHVFTTLTGAMKNAFGGLLSERRHWTHAVIHDTLGDLLAIQKEIHGGLFAVMDGTFAGDGPGPRCMRPQVKNVILASGDQVAIDAVSAKLMGFEPLSIDFIRKAHERGLGCGEIREIEIVGEDISGINWHFEGHKNTLASRGQKMIYHGPLKPLERLLLRTWVTPWSYLASRVYHDFLWYPLVGRGRVRRALQTDWGKHFRNYRPQP
jgi:uncharacterized protein (DUF362 family)